MKEEASSWKDSIKKKPNPNEIPIIFVRDDSGNVQGKVSVNEWTNRHRPSSLNQLEIKLYRQALAYYAEQDLEKAIDILKFLILQTEYTHFEYVERLANIYHLKNELQLELKLLSSTISVAEVTGLPSGLVRKIERRIERIKKNK